MIPAAGWVAATLAVVDSRPVVVVDPVIAWAAVLEHATERSAARSARIVDQWTDHELAGLVVVAGHLVVAHAEGGRGHRVRYAPESMPPEGLRRLVGAPANAPIVRGEGVPAGEDL